MQSGKPFLGAFGIFSPVEPVRPILPCALLTPSPLQRGTALWPILDSLGRLPISRPAPLSPEGSSCPASGKTKLEPSCPKKRGARIGFGGRKGAFIVTTSLPGSRGWCPVRRIEEFDPE